MENRISRDYLERKKIGDSLKAARKKRKYSIAKIEQLLGISSKDINAYEEGLIDIPENLLNKLYRLYGNHPDEVYIPLTKEFGRILKKARVAAKYTLVDAANYTGIQPMTLSSYEKNMTKKIPLEACRKLEILYAIKIIEDLE